MTSINISPSSYIISNVSTSLYDYSCGGTGLLYTSKRIGAVRYTSTTETMIHNGGEYPIYVSDKGKAFIFQVSKTGLEYKKYLK